MSRHYKNNHQNNTLPHSTTATCTDRERELFFHYSEFRGRGGSHELNLGDEVEFMMGRTEERGER